MKRTIEELEKIAENMPTSAEREEVLKIIMRLSHQEREWPSIDELIIIRLNLHHMPEE